MLVPVRELRYWEKKKVIYVSIQETVTGIVLSAMPIGDYDKRLVILTKEYGKISAFAKGARRPNSALLACSQPFVFGNFQLYIGRSSYTIVSADITNYFSELREDLQAIYYGFYFCEFANFLTRENVEAIGMLKLLYQSLRVLTKRIIPFPLVRYIFELKMMFLNGEGPQVFECVSHNSQKEKKQEIECVAFSSVMGGLVCEECAKGKKLIRVIPDTVYTLQFIAATPVEKIFTFCVSEQVLKQLKEIATEYRMFHIETEFKSLEMIDIIQ